jgi:hypothetical protein
MTGHIETDETFSGQKARNMHKAQRAAKIAGAGGKDKTAVIGILELPSQIRTTVAPNRQK